MSKHAEIQHQIINALEEASEGLSQLALMCSCFGYRCVYGKLLYFSVEERMYKQKRKFDEAQQLLERVVSEADVEYQSRLEQQKIKTELNRKREAKLRQLDLVEPPEEIVIQPASRKMVSGKPTLRNLSRIGEAAVIPNLRLKKSISALDSLIKGSIITEHEHLLDSVPVAALEALQASALQGFGSAAIGALRSNTELMAFGEVDGLLQEPQYEVIPEQRKPHPYWEWDSKLADRLERYPKVVWQKIKVERNCVDDPTFNSWVLRNRQATRRAIKELLEGEELVALGKGKEAVYRLSRSG